MGRRGKAPAHPTLAKIEGHYKEKARTRILPIESISGRPSPSLVCQADDLTLQIFEETCDSMQQMGCLSEQDGPIIETYACNYRELLLCIQAMRKDGIEIEKCHPEHGWILIGEGVGCKKSDAQQRAAEAGITFLRHNGIYKPPPPEYHMFQTN